MGLFGRKRADDLVNSEVLGKLAVYGRQRYDGTLDVWDAWPNSYALTVSQLPPDRRDHWLKLLSDAVVSAGGWTAYGAELIVDGELGSPSEDPDRNAIFDASLRFQQARGFWWASLSPLEQIYWQEHHAGTSWADPPRDPPPREVATITPLDRGSDRWLTKLTLASDSKGMVVVHESDGRYVLQLDYPDDSGRRLRDSRDEAGDIYDIYCRLGRGMPYPGVWVDPEFEPFLPFPMPRL